MANHLALPPNPTIYESNTWVWLNDLRRVYGADRTLADLPAVVWDEIAGLGVDAVWLMGVWQRSAAGREIALHNEDLMAEFRRVLPDFGVDDVVGSPYCIRGYEVDDALGGRAGLAAARAALAARCIALLLDFVPNHVAPDHPWTVSNPEYFVQGLPEDLASAPDEFLEVSGHILARGRDPYFAPWPDVVQLNAFAPALRQAMIATLLDIAEQCDGVRCDMVMLMNTEIFTKTWGARAGAPPVQEYWTEIFAAIKPRHPTFVWMAEVYWDMEWRMQQLGFDYCYDKRLYDRLVIPELGTPGTVDSIAAHLHAEDAYQRKLVRFVENHDEARAAAAFPAERLRAATLACATQMGARLFHEGQFQGRRTKVTVFLGRRPTEPPDVAFQSWSHRLLHALNTPLMHDGEWQLCAIKNMTGKPTNVLGWCWHHVATDALALAVVNLSDVPDEVRITAPVALSADGVNLLSFEDMLEAGTPFTCTIDELIGEGAAFKLAPWAAHFWLSISVRH